MKNATGFLFVGLFLVGSVFAAGACGDDETTTSTTSSSSAAASSGDMSSSTTGGGGAGGGMTGDACTTYCTDVIANCTGANNQFSGMDTCMSTCKLYPVAGSAKMDGNSVECRSYHAGAPAKGDPDLHCTHAGPGGNDFCGSNCESFCEIATKACATQWPDKAACMTTCAMFPAMEKYDAMDTAGDSFACRLYHLTVATSSASNATTHCPHTLMMSDQCK